MLNVIIALVVCLYQGPGNISDKQEESSVQVYRVFTEGILHYDVLLTNELSPEPVGSYEIHLKAGKIKHVMSLFNGHQQQTIILPYEKEVIYLQEYGTHKTAVLASFDDYCQLQSRYEHFIMLKETGQQVIAGLKGQKSTIQYRDGTTTLFFYSPKWLLNEMYLFQRLPGLSYLPLYFEYLTEQQNSFGFRLKDISLQPVSEQAFRIPPDYTIYHDSVLHFMPPVTR